MVPARVVVAAPAQSWSSASITTAQIQIYTAAKTCSESAQLACALLCSPMPARLELSLGQRVLGDQGSILFKPWGTDDSCEL